MAVTAVLPGLFPLALTRDPASIISREQAGAALRAPDLVVFSSAPFRVLATLATAGLQQLAALLPALEQAVTDRSPVPLAQLAKAAGSAARQVAEGHVALLSAGPDRLAAALPGNPPAHAPAPDDARTALRVLARQLGATTEPSQPSNPNTMLRTAARQIGAALLAPDVPLRDEQPADPAQRWLSEAKHLLHRTDDALGQAAAFAPLDPATNLPQPSWPLGAILAAQAEIATASARLGAFPDPTRRTDARPSIVPRLVLQHVSSATSVIGLVVVLAIIGLAGGLWSLVAGAVALAGTAFWAWRIGRAARGVRLDARA